MNEHLKMALLIALDAIEHWDSRNIVLSRLDLDDDYVMTDILQTIVGELDKDLDDDHKYHYAKAMYKPESEWNGSFRDLFSGNSEKELLARIIGYIFTDWETAAEDVRDAWEYYPEYEKLLYPPYHHKEYRPMFNMAEIPIGHTSESLAKAYIEIFNRHSHYKIVMLNQVPV